MKQILKRLFGATEPNVVEQPTAKVEPDAQPKRSRASKPTRSAKELATERGEPYINVISVELDPENIGAGAFELDWNDKFLANLVRSGYQKQPNEPEHVIVDRWFQDICRNIVLETFEQEQADPEIRKNTRRNLGNGRTEFS